MIKTGMFEKALSGAMIGAIGGATYGLMRGFLAQPGFAERLIPKPECFGMDDQIAKLFFDLAKYKYNDEKSYIEAMHCMDSLLCLEEQLLLGEVKPQITDPPTAISYGVRAFTHLRNMRSKIMEENIYDEVSGIIKQLERLAENHVNNINLHCRRANVV